MSWTLGLLLGAVACTQGASLNDATGVPADGSVVEAGADAGGPLGPQSDAAATATSAGADVTATSAEGDAAATSVGADVTATSATGDATSVGDGRGNASTSAGENLTDGYSVGTDASHAVSGGEEACATGLEARVRYLASEVENNADCSFEVQTRSCFGGVWTEWSGTYAQLGCEARERLACDGEPSGTVAYRQRYRDEVAGPGVACDGEVQTRECRDGTWTSWSGSFGFERCSSPVSESCADTAHGGKQTRLRYLQESVAYNAQCQLELQERSCADGDWGEWSGSYFATTCSVAEPRACEDALHGTTQARVRYATGVVVDAGCALEAQTRTCLDGTWSDWSGTYTEPSCVAQESDPCVFGYDACGVCGGGGPIRYYSDTDGDGLGNADEPYDLCPGADTFGLVRNAGDLDANCFTLEGSVSVRSLEEAEALHHVCEIDGDVEISLEASQATTLVTIELPALTRIRGRLTASECAQTCGVNQALAWILLPNLREVTDVALGVLPQLRTIDLSSLEGVVGDLTVSSGSTLELSSLMSVGGNMSLGGISSIRASKLEAVEGTLSLARITGLSIWSLRSVGALTITGNSSTIEETLFPRLRTVVRALTIADVPHLRTVRFSALETVGHLEIANAPTLSDPIYLDELVSIDTLALVSTNFVNFSCADLIGLSPNGPRSIYVADNPQLTRFGCRGRSGDDARVTFVSNPRLVSVGVSGMTKAQSVYISQPERRLLVSFSDLESIAESVFVEGQSFEALRMPKLTEVLKDLTVKGEQGVVDLSGLEAVEGDFAIYAGAGELLLSNLKRAGGDLRIESTLLENINAPLLEVVEADLTIIGAAFQRIDFGNLAVVGGGVALARLPHLRELGLPALTNARSFYLHDNAELSVLVLPALERVSGGVSVSNTSILSAIEAPLLVDADGLYIYDNPSLPSCVAENLALQVGASCECNNNDGTGVCVAAAPR